MKFPESSLQTAFHTGYIEMSLLLPSPQPEDFWKWCLWNWQLRWVRAVYTKVWETLSLTATVYQKLSLSL